MTKSRPGYHNLSTQIASHLWDDLCADAERRGESIAEVLNRVLSVQYKRPLRLIPPRRRPGRKPKRP